MKKILSVIIICLVGCGCFMGCSSKKDIHEVNVSKVSTNQNNLNEVQVINEYFKCWNDKDLGKMELLETEEYKNKKKNLSFNNLKSVGIISCKEWDVKEQIKKAIYDKNQINKFDKENVRCFTIQFYTNSNDNKEDKNQKILQGIVILVRKDKKSNWLIRDVMFNGDLY
ncbi:MULTISPECIES: DUF4829 domain-containing protein [Clostridium]|uniref:DUF4829 domain-containing protein n=1 Tax=Clostridium TaxID=1485 RepID=UPI0002E0C1E3|nr:MULTISPECIES: DUF4829 domain-containing protein [Clostridium]KEH86093.1 hypothetical protein Z965_08545 [Clostridium novyi A str. BKT29909]